MISLQESLEGTISSILESYIYTIDKEHQFGDPIIQDAIKHISKAEYLKYLENMFGDKFNDPNINSIIQKAVDVWFDDFGHDPAAIPFAFDENGNVKIRKIVGEKVGFAYKQTKHGITCGNGSIKLGKYISTSDQESATVILWNRIVRHNDSTDLDNWQGIIDAVHTFSGASGKAIDLDEAWAKSCALQINAIKKYIESMGWDWKEYCASRYDDDKYAGSGEIGKLYAKFVSNYIECCKDELGVGASKDTYDPSDIILVRRGEIEWDEQNNEGISILESLVNKTKGKTYEEIHKIYKEMFMSGKIIGISLKKVTGSPKYELFNVGKGSAITNIANIDTKFSQDSSKKKVTGGSATCTGKFKFSDVSDTDDATKDMTENQMIITCRSFSGGKDLDIDLKAPTGPALGKVPRDGWRSLLKTKNDFSEDTIRYIIGQLEDKKIAEQVIELGIKNGPWCLPFVLIH